MDETGSIPDRGERTVDGHRAADLSLRYREICSCTRTAHGVNIAEVWKCMLQIYCVDLVVCVGKDIRFSTLRLWLQQSLRKNDFLFPWCCGSFVVVLINVGK